MTILQGRFRLTELIEAEEITLGSPAIWDAEHAGATFLVKTWGQGAADDAAVRAIWNHEVRSLLRLSGLPLAGERFARLERVGADELGYHVVIDGGGRQLLSEALQARNHHDWLRQLDRPATRARLWKGLQRVAAGLAMLHDQGVLHRGLTPGCIFTDMSGECDFRLSGFEWSIRLSSAAHSRQTGADAACGRMRAPELELGGEAYSVASDWFDFGLLAAEVISGCVSTGGDLDALFRLRTAVQGVRFLSDEERRVLSDLLLGNSDERRARCIDVPRVVAALASRLSLGPDAGSRPLLLGIHLASGHRLGETVAKLTGGKVRRDDIEGQMAFIQEDLTGATTLVARAKPFPHYVVHGQQIRYRVKAHEPKGGTSTWRAGFFQRVDEGGEQGVSIPLDGRPVRLVALRYMEARLRDPNVRSMIWTEVLPLPSVAQPSGASGADLQEFLRFTNTLDTLFAAARIWPVTVASGGTTPRDGNWVVLEAEHDVGRDRLAIALGLETPARQMERAFFEELSELEGEEKFTILEEGNSAWRERHAPQWVFAKPKISRKGRRQYVFRHVQGDLTFPGGRAYLCPAGLAGSNQLFERRLKAIEALSEQPALLRAFEDPASTSHDTLDEFEGDEATAKLDRGKREALAAIWRAQPLFSLQGPPGTGKTALVEALVRNALSTDASLQIVATAQANATVDYLGKKLSGAAAQAKSGEDLLVVRLDKEEDGSATLTPEQVVATLARVLEHSELGKLAPPHIAQRLMSLREKADQQGEFEARYMARLVSRAANVVLATTTSGDLAELLTEGKRFDLSIVEEAGKVHGHDLALPMLASHRLLMIGDHEQLPAFNERAYANLLGNPQSLLEALKNGMRFIPRNLAFDLGPFETEDASAVFEGRCSGWLAMLKTFSHVYNASVATPGISGPIAARLTEQHRMQPELCDLLRACFYPDLETSDDALERLSEPDPFTLRSGTWLPDKRIVFVDLPWMQTHPGAEGQDRQHGRTVLRNRTEASVVVEVLSQIIPEDACEIQVLTPYNPQVKVIRSKIKGALRAGGFGWPQDVQLPRPASEMGATIDSFQGQEADIVIVSLTRHNDIPPPGGVGFVAERPRLNVMLSRARRKLILIGCREFFLSRADDRALQVKDSELHYLAKVFHELEAACEAGTAERIMYPGAGR